MPSIFGYMDTEDLGRYLDLLNALTGNEPCALDPDLFTADWTRGVKPSVAENLCADCPVLDLCRDYAVNAKEPYHVWGGTTPSMRGIPRGYRPWADRSKTTN